MLQSMHADYLTTYFVSLRSELIGVASRGELIEAAERAERLFHEVSAAQSYSCVEVGRQLYPAAEAVKTAGDQVSGEAVQHDLRRLIEDLTDAAGMGVDDVQEPIYTIDELSGLWNVSTKTINRWREVGLIGRRFLVDGKKRVGFMRSSAEQFARAHPRRLRRGSRFRHLSESERLAILDAVREKAIDGVSRSQVFGEVAKQMDCSVETVRTTTKRYEEQHPESSLFGDGDSPLSESLVLRMYAGYRRGASFETLAEHYGRSPSTVRRLINQRRAALVEELPLDHIYSGEFAQRDAERTILCDPPEPPRRRQVRPPKDVPAYLKALYEVPLLTADQERHEFRRMNYLKWKASQLRDQLVLERPSGKLLDKIETLYEQASSTKNRIVKANLRLVVSIVRKRLNPMQDLFDLISDGNVSLMCAVDKFDYSRGFKFSTYASWAIVKNLARTVPAEFKHAGRFRTSQDELLDAMRDHRSNRYRLEEAQRSHEDQVSRILRDLNERERRIIVRRFGLDRDVEPQTLKELGEELGVTKERVRQLQTRAMKKLRSAAEQARIVPPLP